jgi:hypothetical protein
MTDKEKIKKLTAQNIRLQKEITRLIEQNIAMHRRPIVTIADIPTVSPTY